VPAGTPHAYRVEEAARLTGTMTGGFERFFQHMGTLTDHATTQQPPFIPDFPRMQAAAQQHAMRFMPDYRWPTAGEDVVTTPTPPGLVRPDTDPLPDPVDLDGGLGHLRRAVAYSAPPGFRPLELDLYTPAGPPAPVILFVHGGGLRMGTREVLVPTLRDWRPGPFHRLVAAGFAVASIDYRLSAEAVFPAQLDDVREAAGFLLARADELSVDATQVSPGASPRAPTSPRCSGLRPPPRSRASSTGTAPPT
jgi:hypothetical protein